jgi:hypothetical protein
MKNLLLCLTFAACAWVAPGYAADSETPPASAADSAPAAACKADEEASAGVCYPKCRDGFKGEGTLCKSICPERTQDVDDHCLSGPAQFRKKTYERAATAPTPR